MTGVRNMIAPHFREYQKGEVPRMPLLGSRVNKGKKEDRNPVEVGPRPRST
jgi:hypothetical protein